MTTHQTGNPLLIQHLLKYFDKLWSIMLGQADCTKPADRQLIQTGTNDDWHFKQSVWADNSSFFPVVPSCSMLLRLLLMNSCAAYSVYQPCLLLFGSFFLSLYLQWHPSLWALCRIHMSWYCCVILCLEGREEPMCIMFNSRDESNCDLN